MSGSLLFDLKNPNLDDTGQIYFLLNNSKELSQFLEITDVQLEEIPPEIENGIELIFREINDCILEQTFPSSQIEALTIDLTSCHSLAALYEGQYPAIISKFNEILPSLIPQDKSTLLAFFATLLEFSVAGTETESISDSFFSNILGSICSLLADDSILNQLHLLIPALKCMHYYARRTRNIKEFSNEISFFSNETLKRGKPINFLLQLFDKLQPLDEITLQIRQCNGSQIVTDETFNEICKLIWKFLNAYLLIDEIPMSTTHEIMETLMKHLCNETSTEEIREYIFFAAQNAIRNERSYLNFLSELKENGGYSIFINYLDANVGEKITCSILISIKTIIRRNPGEAELLISNNFLEHLLNPFHSDDVNICVNAIQLFIEFVKADSEDALPVILQSPIPEELYLLTEVSTHLIKIAAFSALYQIVYRFDHDQTIEFIQKCPEILERAFVMLGSELDDDEFDVLVSLAIKFVETLQIDNAEALEAIIMNADIIPTLDTVLDQSEDRMRVHSSAFRLRNILCPSEEEFS